MAWGLIIPEVYLNRVHKDELESKIEESNSYIQSMKEEMIALMAATPRDIKGEDGEIVPLIR